MALWHYGPIKELIKGTYRVEQNNSCLLEFPAILLPTNLGQTMHSLSALTEYLSLNLAGIFLLKPVQGSDKRRSPGLVNSFAAVAYHFCLALPVAFTQPRYHLLNEPCTEIGKKAWLFAKLQPGRARKRFNAT